MLGPVGPSIDAIGICDSSGPNCRGGTNRGMARKVTLTAHHKAMFAMKLYGSHHATNTSDKMLRKLEPSSMRRGARHYISRQRPTHTTSNPGFLRAHMRYRSHRGHRHASGAQPKTARRTIMAPSNGLSQNGYGPEIVDSWGLGGPGGPQKYSKR